MALDPDSLVLDRVFQTAADRQSGWITCFGLARVCVGLAVALHVIVLSYNLAQTEDFAGRLFDVGITALAFFGADQTRHLIARAERKTRPGLPNVHRITLRWQRVSWLVVFSGVVMTSLAHPEPAALGGAAACLAWLAAIYFVSCSPRPPAVRRSTRLAWAASRA